MARVAHFELTADDPERASAFYSEVFGWQLQRWEGGQQDYWLITTGDESEPGINGGLLRRSDMPGQPVVNTVSVDSVDDAVGAVEANGGSVMLPKMAVSGIGWLAYCRDTEGNMFGLMQADPTA
jgi:predicted enzyme related to lactoylglutathione lyase